MIVADVIGLPIAKGCGQVLFHFSAPGVCRNAVIVLNGLNQAWKNCCQVFHKKRETFTSEARLVLASAIFANPLEMHSNAVEQEII
jgi:hypothetical protein